MAILTVETLRLNIVVNGDAARKAMIEQADIIERGTKRLGDMKEELQQLEKTEEGICN